MCKISHAQLASADDSSCAERLFGWLFRPRRFQKLPWQRAAHPLYKLVFLLGMCSGPLYYLVLCEVLLPLGAPTLDRQTAWLHAFHLVPLLFAGVAISSAVPALVVHLVRSYRLRLALQPAPDCSGGRLHHVLVIPAYKEPRAILQMTLRSAAAQTHGAKRLDVVLATEAKDATAVAEFDALHKEFGDAFGDLWRTSHVLGAGEVAGKSSNENHALEWAWLQYPSPERLVFSPPLNTYRNYFEAPLLIRAFELLRVHNMFEQTWAFQSAQSNYSLSLALAHEIDYWTPDNTPEDLHTSLKTFVHTNGSMSVVPLWTLISNDLVTGYADRYVQAKRHKWGVTESVWTLVTYPTVPFRVWSKLVAYTMREQLANSFPPSLMLLYPGFWRFLHAISPLTLHVLLVTAGIRLATAWAARVATELVLWRVVLPDNPAFPAPTQGQWAKHLLMLALLPPIDACATLMYETMPSLHALLHSFRSTHLEYVTAPKAFTTAMV